MGAHTHIVKKLTLQLEQVSVNDAFSGRDSLSSYFRDQFPVKFQELLDRQFDPSETIYIDSLKIDLQLGRRLDAATIDNELYKQLEQALKQFKIQSLTNTIKEQSKVEYANIEAFFFFLETGCLPWWHQPASFELMQLQLLDQFKTSVKKSYADRFLNLLQKDNPAKRFVLQFNRETKIAILKSILNYEVTLGHLDEIILKESANKYGKTEIVIWENIIADLLLPENTQRFQPPDKKEQVPLPANAMKPLVVKKGLSLDNESIYVKNAGIVLLHPFLDTLFTILGYKNDDRNELSEKYKAVNILAHLCGFDEELPEYELPLLKLLCGVEFDEAVAPLERLNDNEKMECMILLQQVTGYWEPLRRSSAVALQETFFRRDGKLSLDSNGWLLQVEQKTVDILLDKLPWGFSMIKFPWMKKLLRVEWN